MGNDIFIPDKGDFAFENVGTEEVMIRYIYISGGYRVFIHHVWFGCKGRGWSLSSLTIWMSVILDGVTCRFTIAAVHLIENRIHRFISKFYH